MKPRRSRENFTIALGISAIDVLCCSLVSSILLFLILTSPAKKNVALSSGGNEPTLIVSFAVTDDNPIVRVLVYPGDTPELLPVEFWAGNAAQVTRPPSSIKLGDVSSLYRDGGFAWWIPSEAAGSNRLPSTSGPSSSLVVRNPSSGNWKIKIGYAGYYEAKAIPRKTVVTVSATNFLSDCATTAEQKFELGMWATVIIADQQAGTPSDPCSLAKVLKISAAN